MKFRDDAKKILRRAWSIRIIAVSAILSGLEVVLSLLDAEVLGLPRGAFAAIAGLVSALAIPARLMAQSAFAKDESGAFKRRVGLSAAALAAVVALALPAVKQWEGRSLVAYRDIVGIPTICDGETRGVKMGDKATPIQCDAMTEATVREFEAAIRPCLPDILPTETRAAFVVTAYNIGVGAFCASSMSRRAMAGDLPGACQAIVLFNNGTFDAKGAERQRAQGQTCTRKADGNYLCTVRGLTNRRMAERDLCLKGLL